MPKETILIAEDEISLVEILSAYLVREGYNVLTTEDGSRVNDIVIQHDISLLLLDVMLPKMMGFEVLCKLRSHSSVPVIIITSLDAESQRLKGFELGADDYVCKPFSPREVVARVKSVLKRAGSAFVDSTLQDQGASGALFLDDSNSTVYINKVPVVLTLSEYKLLSVLVRRPNCIFSRDQLLDEITDVVSESSYRAIDSHIKNIRKKLAEHEKQPIIHTVYGVGYKITLPV